ncbi:hypothetical protein [Leptothermofonsia sp. ETS-13]|uniref:hypothetical protein n=1 Tax=Leptothermofonsia sp. ETS-13 TaxID=3035696 RepID=UPI003BA18519
MASSTRREYRYYSGSFLLSTPQPGVAESSMNRNFVSIHTAFQQRLQPSGYQTYAIAH